MLFVFGTTQSLTINACLYSLVKCACLSVNYGYYKQDSQVPTYGGTVLSGLGPMTGMFIKSYELTTVPRERRCYVRCQFYPGSNVLCNRTTFLSDIFCTMIVIYAICILQHIWLFFPKNKMVKKSKELHPFASIHNQFTTLFFIVNVYLVQSNYSRLI